MAGSWGGNLRLDLGRSRPVSRPAIVAIVLLATFGGAVSGASFVAPTPAGAPSPPPVHPAAALAPHPLAASSPIWTNLTNLSSSAPSGRYLSGMTYDAGDGYALLFGGYGASGVDSDTWSFQDGTWSGVTGSGVSPTAWYAPAMAYDAKDNETVLFGGYDSSTGLYSPYTWVFANGTWTNLSANLTTHPGARWRAHMVWDSADGYVLLFGGTDSSGTPLSDTWKFVGNKWTDLTSSVTGSPSGRYRFAMAYDTKDKEAVVYGGCTSTATTCATSDTWTYSNLTWKQLAITAPSARVYPQMEYDANLSEVILFGGSQESGTGPVYGDTWAFSAGAWTNLTSSVGAHPPARGYQMMAYDPVGQYIVMFGGETNSAPYFDDTWAFGPKILAWATASPAATDQGGATTISVTTITSGSGLTYSYSGLPTGCSSSNTSSLPCTPNATGSFTINVSITDAAGDSAVAQVTLVVAPWPSLVSFTASLSTLDVGMTTNLTVNATGGTGAYRYAYSHLPRGCSSANVAVLTCVPTLGGLIGVDVQVRDAVGGSVFGSVGLLIHNLTSVKNFSALPGAIDQGQTAQLYANVTNGTAPFTWSWSNLPGGSCASANVNPLPCTPASPGTYAPIARVADTFGRAVAQAIPLTVNPLPTILTAGLSASRIDAGVPVTFFVNVSGGTAPYLYSFANLPGGCTLASSAAPTCTPTATGTFGVVATVTDAVGETSDVQLNLTTIPGPSVSRFTSSPSAIDLSQTLALSVTATGGTAPYLYSYANLPVGCTSVDVGTLSCVPTAPGTSQVTVTVKDAWRVATHASINVTVNPALDVLSITATPASVSAGGTLSISVAVRGGTLPYTYAYSGLPSGCAGQNLSTLSCIPSGANTYTLFVSVTDAAGESGSQSTSVTIAAPSGSGGGGGSGQLFGLSAGLAYALIGVIVVVVVIALALLLSRRRRLPPPPAEEAPAMEPSTTDEYPPS